MKSWTIFGFGLLLGTMLGVFSGLFFATFYLYNDLTATPSSATLSVAAAKHPSRKMGISSGSLPPEVKPSAVAAEAVDIETLPPSQEEEGTTPTEHGDTVDSPTTR